MPTDTFPTIDLEALSRVSGGATSNDQITAALSAITNSLSQLSASRNQSDPTMMMMMMMMMMGGGGGGVVAAPGVAAGAGAAPPVINVDTSVLSRAGGLAGLLGGGYGGGYGFGGGGCCGCGCKCW
jgi:hypothetical protein